MCGCIYGRVCVCWRLICNVGEHDRRFLLKGEKRKRKQCNTVGSDYKDKVTERSAHTCAHTAFNFHGFIDTDCKPHFTVKILNASIFMTKFHYAHSKL